MIAAAGLPAGEALRGPALTTLIVAEAGDGYRVAFSLAAADGPLRLVMPGEIRAARSVRQLRALRVVSLP
jgi:hypothetical protein